MMRVWDARIALAWFRLRVRFQISFCACFSDEKVCPAAWTGGQRSNPASESSQFVWKLDKSVWEVPTSSAQLGKSTHETHGACLIFQWQLGVAWYIDVEDCTTKACVICELQPRREHHKEKHWTKNTSFGRLLTTSVCACRSINGYNLSMYNLFKRTPYSSFVIVLCMLSLTQFYYTKFSQPFGLRI